MKESKMTADVLEYIKSKEGNLVLIINDDGNYSVVDKKIHFLVLIDDELFGEELIRQLKEMNVDIFRTFDELKKKFPKQIVPPINWPSDKRWPPSSR